MENELCFFLFNVSKSLSQNAIFFIFNGAILFTMTLCIIFLFIKRQAVKRIRFLYVIFSLIIIINQSTFTILCTENISTVIVFALCGISIFLMGGIPVFLLPPKRRVKRAESELIRALDRDIELENISNCDKNDFKEKEVRINQVEEDCEIVKEKSDIDFSHVKNIIERLDYYSLSSSDKTKVKELKDAVFYAEKYGVEKDTKVKINDGLGYLLKIMSKYGI